MKEKIKSILIQVFQDGEFFEYSKNLINESKEEYFEKIYSKYEHQLLHIIENKELYEK